jgi:hypothetical protein
MKRGGGWLLGLLIVAAMAGGGWLDLRRVLSRETVIVLLLRPAQGRDPTQNALMRGAQSAIEEADHRAGRYRVLLDDLNMNEVRPVVAWIGTSEAALMQGDRQPPMFFVSAFDTHPAEPTGCFRVSPGCEQQGRAAAGWVKRQRASRVVAVCDTDSLRSTMILKAFGEAAMASGPKLTRIESSGKPDLVDRILEERPDLVFYSGEEAPYATSHRLFSALRGKGFAGTLVMGEADPEVSFLATRPDLVDGTYLVSPFAPAPPELAKAMGATPGPHVTAGYVAMKAVLDAIDRANSIDTAELQRAAARLPYFDAQGRAALRKCALYVARGGAFEFVELLD